LRKENGESLFESDQLIDYRGLTDPQDFLEGTLSLSPETLEVPLPFGCHGTFFHNCAFCTGMHVLLVYYLLHVEGITAGFESPSPFFASGRKLMPVATWRKFGRNGRSDVNGLEG